MAHCLATRRRRRDGGLRQDLVSDETDIDLKPAEEAPPSEGSLADGMRIIGEFVHTLPRKPGVYRMIAADGEVLYVGKARSLRSRVAAYTQPTRLDNRLLRMVSGTKTMEFSVTDSEAEALLLENNLIKRFKPRFNVLLRDDKSFPYIVIRRDTEWPQLAKHRGVRDPGNEYFGPFASATAVNRTLYALQRAFPLRSCSDGVFSTRTRPCLQYQIKRCTAPCVGRIDKPEYGAIVDEVRGFLGGRNREVQQALSQRMEQASVGLEFERAAVLRDRIRALAHIQSHQSIALPSIDEADIFAAHAEGGQMCVQVFFLRAGQNLGNRAYFPSPHQGSRRARRAVGLHRPVLRSAPGTQADPDQPRRGRARVAGKRARAHRRPQGRDPPSQARRPEGRARPGGGQCPRGAGPAHGRARHAAPAAGRRGPRVRPRRAARAHRNLRQQPHPGRSADRRHGGGGAGRLQQEFLSQVQHQDRGRGGRRLRHDARGPRPAASAARCARIPSATTRAGPTWC